MILKYTLDISFKFKILKINDEFKLIKSKNETYFLLKRKFCKTFILIDKI
jgi:hypothetical protein